VVLSLDGATEKHSDANPSPNAKRLQ
jgi:hypothetical protein